MEGILGTEGILLVWVLFEEFVFKLLLVGLLFVEIVSCWLEWVLEFVFKGVGVDVDVLLLILLLFNFCCFLVIFLRK
jgi:hypothetical protein